MDAPRTASGSPCKLCLKKGPGGRCHLHGGTPGSSAGSPKSAPGSPKRASPKKQRPSAQLYTGGEWPLYSSPSGSPRRKSPGKASSPRKALKGSGFATFETFFSEPFSSKSPKKTPAEFHYLESLGHDLLPEVLLRMDWLSIRKVCNLKINGVREICRNPHFQQRYVAEHGPPPFIGELKLINKEVIPRRGTSETIYSFKSATGINVKLFVVAGKLLDIFIRFPDPRNLGGVQIRLIPSFSVLFTKASMDRAAEQRRYFFVDFIHRPDWYALYSAKRQDDISRELINNLKVSISDKDISSRLFDDFLKKL